uniref:COP9 signalosome complex subunit 5 n=1 Tax=Loxodonta africana TaxID=9785 RepID=G3UH41_LOXAF
NLELMGLMLGNVDGETIIITDSFALPVGGTKTVNVQDAALELKLLCHPGTCSYNATGWYHSHPLYGCWLSGIDVSTQMLQEPFVAVVIDPTRTGKVNLGAITTYSKGYKLRDEGPSVYQTILFTKIENFAINCKQYFALDHKWLELLWNKYWVNMLSSSCLFTNINYTTGQAFGSSEKLELGLGLETHGQKSVAKLAKATQEF